MQERETDYILRIEYERLKVGGWNPPLLERVFTFSRNGDTYSVDSRDVFYLHHILKYTFFNFL